MATPTSSTAVEIAAKIAVAKRILAPIHAAFLEEIEAHNEWALIGIMRMQEEGEPMPDPDVYHWPMAERVD